MILRVHGRDRIMKIELPDEASVECLVEEITSRAGSACTALSFEEKALTTGSLKDAGLQDGAILKAEYTVPCPEQASPAQEASKGGEKEKEGQRAFSACKHGPSGMCDQCAPEDSWLSSSFENRRFVSQGAYEEYLASKDKELVMESHMPPLCRTHPASARCNKCLPKEIALTRQLFRPVDHVELHDTVILEQIIGEQREKGVQSVHLLVGRYSAYPEVAKGVKAEVFCLVQVEHKGLQNGFVINPEDGVLKGTDKSFSELLRLLGMEVVGMVYTRVSKEELPFISSLEVEFIGRMQNMFPYVDGGKHKGSRFVTLVIAGTAKTSEVMECSASHLAMELLQDGLLFSSKNPLEMEVHPVTAVWTDKEGSQVGHTVPVEYLVVRPTHGVTLGKGIFCTKKARGSFKRGQGLSALKKHFQKRITEGSVQGLSLEAVSDFQVLLELADMSVLTPELVQAVLSKDELGFMEGVIEGKYAALVEITKECEDLPAWSCEVCTLTNQPSSTVCDACGIPRQA
ncbi:nuclear protein localization protein 4 [Nematocida sp. AWRm77]|nr:nuclear protein localization protein 4 [Nematocida sp. AWRm77]